MERIRYPCGLVNSSYYIHEKFGLNEFELQKYRYKIIGLYINLEYFVI